MLQVHRVQRHYLSLVWLLLIATAGCLPQRATSTADPALPLADALPTTWQALRDVEPVNIDGDALTEYLLFFTYNNTVTANNTAVPGPVGTVIYDPQAGYTPNLAGNSRAQPSSALVPYAILPSYRPGTGQGFVAEPSQRETVDFFPINFRTRAADTAETPPADALVIRGGNRYVTFVWWQNPDAGYGVTQLYAAGGFERAPQQPFGWAAWEDDPQPIKEIIAVQPLQDRNLLCRRIRHRLVQPTQAELAGNAPIRAITYQGEDLGIQFCNGVPPDPFYPEAVVLAYLLTGRADLLDLSAPNPQTPERFNQLVAREQLVRVEDLAAYQTVTAAPDLTGNERITLACAEVTVRVNPSGQVSRETATATPDAANSGSPPPVERRWLLFTLRHQPPQLNPPTADQFHIINVNALAAPQDGVRLNCHQQLGG